MKSLLPQALRRKLEGRNVLQAVLANAGWQLADRAVRLAVGLLVGTMIARYLGPLQYGTLNFALALLALFGVFANLGLDTVVVRELARGGSQREAILGTALVLKAIGGLVAAGGGFIAGMLVAGHDPNFREIVGVLALAFMFQAFDVFDLWFRSVLQTRYAVAARQVAFLGASALKLTLVALHAPLIAFAWAVLAESVVAAIALAAFYRGAGGRLSAWRPARSSTRRLLLQCWPLALSGLMVGLYMRIDQVMLGSLAGAEAVGVYAVGVLLSEIWHAVPTALVGSVAPVLAKMRDEDPIAYRHHLQALFRWLVLLAYLVAVPVSLLSGTIIGVLFGPAYADAAPVLAVHIWTGVFVSLGVASSQYLLLEDLNRISLQRTLMGTVLNIVLNILWIPAYGPLGAAWAAVISYAVAALCLFQTRASRECLRMLLTALWPFRRPAT